MKKLIFLLIIFSQIFTFAFSQEESETETEIEKIEEKSRNLFIPTISFKMLQIDEKDFVLSPSGNFQYMRIKGKDSQSKGPDMIGAGLSYSLDHFTQGLGPRDVKNIHGCSAMLNLRTGKNSFMGMLASTGELPFSSVKTLAGALLYTRQFIKTENKSFTGGLGLVVGDFDVSFKGMDIYFFPLPVFSFNYKNDIFAASISVMGPPAFKLTLFPEAMFRFEGSLGLIGFKSIRDLGFDCALVCYPFIKNQTKDMISFAAGVMNTSRGFVLKDKSKYSFQYYSVYGEINATFASLQCGYIFYGKKLIEKEIVGDMYKGLFASLNLMFMM